MCVSIRSLYPSPYAGPEFTVTPTATCSWILDLHFMITSNGLRTPSQVPQLSILLSFQCTFDLNFEQTIVIKTLGQRSEKIVSPSVRLPKKLDHDDVA